MIDFSMIWLNKHDNKNKPVGVFQFCFQLWEAWRYFPIFVVLYLEIVENIDQMYKVLFPITS